ncbi:MAG: glycosyltransferase family 4 protein [Bacteroidales bacterium]|nr:glycosyltransferase family 4 protein [Bacteroidales bacterium]
MKRIVQIGPYPESPECIKGGVEASVYGLAQEQGKTMEVHVFDFPRIGGRTVPENDGAVTVHRYRNSGKRQAASSVLIKAMAKEICDLRPDVCHIHGTGLFSWLLYRKLRKSKQRIAVTVHGLASVEKRNLLRKRFTLKRLAQFVYQSYVERTFLSQLRDVIVDTKYVEERISRFPIRRKPAMHVIPQGINDAFFKMKCSPESRVFLSVGAIGPRKGHLITLQAFERLRQHGIASELVIAGVVADGAYLRQLDNNIRNSEFGSSVRLLTDLNADDLWRLYGEAHVFVLHSEEESQGIVFAEAMATGMPVVATEVGGVPHVVKNGANGLLAAYSDVKDFSEKMAVLMQDPLLWQKMSAEAVIASQRYHWSRINDAISKLYKLSLNE